jgi:hypothetical protein
MPNPEDRKRFAFDRPGIYRVRVLGSLDESWSERLGGLRIETSSLKDQEGPVTELVGKVRDQAELAGILNTLYESHLTLVSVSMLEGGE